MFDPASIIYKSTAGRYRPVSYPDGPITARCRFIKNAYWGVSCVRSLSFWPMRLFVQEHVVQDIHQISSINLKLKDNQLSAELHDPFNMACHFGSASGQQNQSLDNSVDQILSLSIST